MSDSGHSAGNQPFFRQSPDRRVGETDRAVQRLQSVSSSAEAAADPYRQLMVHRLLGDSGGISIGRVVYSLQHMNWYRVETREHGSIPCCASSLSGLTACATKEFGQIMPQSMVLVWRPKTSSFGVILGVIPASAGSVYANPDRLHQGSSTGITKEGIHLQWLRQTLAAGGSTDFNCGRPSDATVFDRGIMAHTGVGLIVSPFEAILRVNEMTGLLLSYWDDYTRLSGRNLDILAPGWSLETRDDEGEIYGHSATSVYPWEFQGARSPMGQWYKENTTKTSQYDLPEATIEPLRHDTQQLARYQEYSGYLGQGHLRFLMCPAQEQVRTFGSTAPDHGLFMEQIGLQGALVMRSAYSLTLSKRVLIPVPRRRRLCEDQESGESRDKKNYKFSGMGEDGEPHVVGQLAIPYDPKHVLQVAGLLDVLAYQFNWLSHHPFHYHHEDFHTPDESDLAPFTAATEKLDFDTLSTSEFMRFPEPKQLEIDHRYGNVDYYQRESMISLLPDGSVVIGDGYGSQITMFGGKLRLEAPGDIELIPGKRVIAMGSDVILRAHRSVDISAAKKDVRIKAGNNMQVMAKGGILVESQSQGVGQSYTDKFGEDVKSNGIVLLSRRSEIGLLGRDIYLRTGGGSLKNGMIVLDASLGSKQVVVQCKNMDVFATKALNIWHGPGGNGHRFSPKTSIIAGKLIVEKSVIIGSGNLAVGGNVIASKNIVAGGNLAHKKPPFVGSSAKIDFSAPFAQITNALAQFAQAGKTSWEGELNKRWYQDLTDAAMLGSAALHKDMGFSFRDPPGPPVQYRSQNYSYPETRWQQLIRIGLATGGQSWDEPPVVYQSIATYPYPGRDNWTSGNAYVGYANFQIFDQATGRNKPRTDPAYQQPTLAGATLLPMNANFKVIH